MSVRSRVVLALVLLSVLILSWEMSSEGPVVDTVRGAPTAGASDLGTPAVGCRTETTCADGSTLSCTAPPGQSCRSSPGRCPDGDCTESRGFVECGKRHLDCP